MFRIRRFGVLRTANVVALFYLVAFAILIVPFVLFMLLATPRGLPAFATGAAVGGALAALLIYPLLGWVFTAIACLLYNLVARWAGGIEVEVERVPPAGYAGHGYPYGAPYGSASGQPYAGQGPPEPLGRGQAPPYGQVQSGAPWSSGSTQRPPGSPPEPPA